MAIMAFGCSAGVHAGRTQRFDLVFGPQRPAGGDVEFPGRNAGRAGRERQQVLAVLERALTCSRRFASWRVCDSRCASYTA